MSAFSTALLKTGDREKVARDTVQKDREDRRRSVAIAWVLIITLVAAVIIAAFVLKDYHRERRQYEDYTRGFKIQKFVIKGGPKHNLMAYYHLPESEPPYPGILFIHGNLPKGKDVALYREWCRRLAQLGYAVLSFDTRGYGEYALVNDLDVHTDLDFVADAVQAARYMAKDGRIKESIAVAGHSSGANIALATAAMVPEIRYAILSSPGNLDPENEDLPTKKHLIWRFSLDLRFDLTVDEYDKLITPLTIRKYLPLRQNLNVLIVIADRDARDQKHFAAQISEEMNVPCKLAIIEDSIHTYGYKFFDGDALEDPEPMDKLIEIIGEWFKENRFGCK